MKTIALTAEAQCARCGRKQTVDDVQWTCAGCGGANIESPNIFKVTQQETPASKTMRRTMTPVMDSLVTAPQAGEIPLMAVLRSLNSMSSDGVDQLYKRLSILNLVHEANRWRTQESDHFDQVKRVLSSSGVVGLD